MRVALAGFVLAAAACTLTACGRAGPPELPPGPALTASPTAAAPPPIAPLGPPPVSTAAAASHETAQKTGFDAYGNPVAPPSERKSFFLDFLLQ